MKENSTDPSSFIMLDLEKCLGEVLSSILQTEMIIAYGDLWTEVITFYYAKDVNVFN